MRSLYKGDSDYKLRQTCGEGSARHRPVGTRLTAPTHPVSMHSWSDRNAVSSRDKISKIFMEHEIEYFTKNGDRWGRDQYGEFKADAGTPDVPDDEDFNYQPCKAVLKFTHQRYGEVRYCTAMAENNFDPDGSHRCKVHKGRDNLMEQHRENYETGAFTHSYVTMFDKMKPHKRIVCIRMFRDFLEQSIYEFEPEDVVELIDTSDEDWTDQDEIAVTFPVPTTNTNRAKYLWVATLEFIKAENIEEQMFQDAMRQQNAPGEITVTVYGEQGPVGEEDREHHLNLPLSRIIKDHKNLLKMGGVDMATNDDGSVKVTEREWVIDMDEPKPEANPMNDPFEQNVEA